MNYQHRKITIEMATNMAEHLAVKYAEIQKWMTSVMGSKVLQPDTKLINPADKQTTSCLEGISGTHNFFKITL